MTTGDAGVLREAAALMRERAQAVTPGPWTHIAAFASPAVALAVADWLDYTASYVPRGKRGWTDAMRHALAVATAYLNGGSP